MARLFESTRRRDPLRRRVLGIASVAVLAAVVAGLIVITQLATTLGVAGLPGIAAGAEILSTAVGAAVASVALFSVGIALIYRFVPTNQPTWRMIGTPSLVVGSFVAIFTALFTALTPQFVGSLQIYGAFVAVFAAMIWLSFVSQALLVGAAWVHGREREVTPPAASRS